MELDPEGRLVPRLATSWRWLDAHTLEVTLRHGVRFHNGGVFDAEIVRLNWDHPLRLRQPLAPGTYMNFKRGSKPEIIDPYAEDSQSMARCAVAPGGQCCHQPG
jgi:peptide/nickel transport system substrate-binding protein